MLCRRCEQRPACSRRLTLARSSTLVPFELTAHRSRRLRSPAGRRPPRRARPRGWAAGRRARRPARPPGPRREAGSERGGSRGRAAARGGSVGRRGRAGRRFRRRLEVGPLGGELTGPGRDRQAEALGRAATKNSSSLRPPGGSTALRWRCAAALEVDDCAVPLEVARARHDEVRLEGVVAHVHRRREDELRARGELEHARVVRGLVTGDDECADLALRGRFAARPFAGLVPGPRDSAPVRRAREHERGDLAGQRAGESGESPAAVGQILRPDEGDAACLPEPLCDLGRRRREEGMLPRPGPSAGRRPASRRSRRRRRVARL